MMIVKLRKQWRIQGSRKKTFWETGPPLISRSGSGTEKVGVFLLNTLYNKLNVIMKIKWFLKMLPVLYFTDYHSPKHQVSLQNMLHTASPLARALIVHHRK